MRLRGKKCILRERSNLELSYNYPTESRNLVFLAVVEELLSRPNLTPEEDAMLELLVRLIEDFEAKHYQLNASKPHSILLHLMEARSLETADLVETLGAREVSAEVVNGEVEISKKQAKVLGEFFQVDPSFFCQIWCYRLKLFWVNSFFLQSFH